MHTRTWRSVSRTMLAILALRCSSDYIFGKSPYSLGGMAEYFTSNGYGDWFIAPHAEGVGFQLSRT